MRPLPAVALFFAFTAPVGIAAHLASEFFGLGWHDDAEVFFSARHGYLALIAVAALAALAFAIGSVPRGERRARVERLIDRLPFRGTGVRFTVLAFAAQFAFFAITQLGEGCPLCGGDIVVGVFAAAIAALVGALSMSLGKRRVLQFVLAIVYAFVAALRTPLVRPEAIRRSRPLTTRSHRIAFTFRSRPPPTAA